VADLFTLDDALFAIADHICRVGFLRGQMVVALLDRMFAGAKTMTRSSPPVPDDGVVERHD
jgi:hypothetical protein